MSTLLNPTSRPGIKAPRPLNPPAVRNSSSGDLQARQIETFTSSEEAKSSSEKEASFTKRGADTVAEMNKPDFRESADKRMTDLEFLATTVGVAGFVGLATVALTGGLPVMAAAATAAVSSGLIAKGSAVLRRGREEEQERGETPVQDSANKAGLGTKLGWWLKGVKPMGKEVDKIADGVAAVRARVKRIKKELEQRPVRDSEGKPYEWHSRSTATIHRFEGDGHDQLIEELILLEGEVMSLSSQSWKRLERVLEERHPELVGTGSRQEETWGSILGTVVGGYSGRTGNMKTVQWKTFPKEISKFTQAVDNLVARAGNGIGNTYHIGVPNSRSLDAVDEALNGLRKLADSVEKPSRSSPQATALHR